jgi:hypothetical protein
MADSEFLLTKTETSAINILLIGISFPLAGKTGGKKRSCGCLNRCRPQPSREPEAEADFSYLSRP